MMGLWSSLPVILLTALLVARAHAGISTGTRRSSATGDCNSPSTRACWTDGFDINTDYETLTPDGIRREYDWEISEIDNWAGPDGVVKEKVMLINEQFPGPTIYADWGDTIVVNVRNRLRTNG
jgi:hypothetical protein